MSDPNNGPWTAIGFAKAGVGSLAGYSGQIFFVPSAVNAPTTVTLTMSSTVVFRAFECAEYSYTGIISALDGTPLYSTTPASGGVATINGLTTSNSNDLVFADCLAVDTTCAAGSGYTGLDDPNTRIVDEAGGGVSFWGRTGQLIEYNVGAAAGAQSATFGTGTPTDNVILGLLALTVDVAQTPPIVTSSNSATFAVGTAGSFTVTTTGTPAPSLTETGALPSGVTFIDNGNGTATLSGTPAAGTDGTYTLTFTGDNGVGTPASQNFVLTVNSITSKGTLTVTAFNASRLYGVTNPTFTYAISGFVNGDTQSVVSGAPSLTTTATTSSPDGTYPINAALGTLSAPGYNFAFANGTLTISSASAQPKYSRPMGVC